MRILTTVTGPPSWTDRVDLLRREDRSPRQLVRALVSRAPGYDAVVVNGSTGASEWYADLVAAGIIGHRRGAPPVLVIEANWKRGARAPVRLGRRLAIGLIDAPPVHYTVFSHAARWAVASTWGMDPARIHAALCPITLSLADLEAPAPIDGGVFAGGNSLRDYTPMLTAAALIDAPITIATSCLTPEQVAALPPGVRAGPLPREEYAERLRRASIVVVPLELRTDRSAGEQTCLNAMALGKIVIATDALGIREYVEDGVTGMVVPAGDAGAIVRAVTWARDPDNASAVASMRAEARLAVEQRFLGTDYVDCFLQILERLCPASGREASVGAG